MTDLPTIRWGIVATGGISKCFVRDIAAPSWPGKKANHIITAIGSSSLDKGNKFVSDHLSHLPTDLLPKVYGSYAEVYAEPSVTCVYIGTPHSFHHRNCLDAIAAGKHVLCEKPFALTAAQSAQVFAAAKQAGTFIMEAVWTRYFPLVRNLQHLLHSEKVIGNIQRTFCDFSLGIGDIDALPATSRYRDPALGAGSLLDLGIYSITWGLLTLDSGVGAAAEKPVVVSQQSLQSAVDVASTVLLFYPETGRQAVLTSTTNVQGSRDFARVEGSKGTVTIFAEAASMPEYFVVKMHGEEGDGKRFDFERPGMGYFWMADSVAVSISQGKVEDDLMPWGETQRVMEIMDGVRKRGGAKFDVDKW